MRAQQSESMQPESAQPASAQPALLRGAGITQQMDAQAPLDLTFRDETGKTVRLRDYFGAKPIVLSLVYFNCPSLCTEVMNGELRAMRNVSLNLGKDYEAITVSFDPKDGPAEAEVKRRIYSGLYGRAGSSRAWHFLTGDQKSIDSLTDAQAPLDLTFSDETGKTVRLRDYFGAKPIVLSLVYFNCPSLCTEVMNGELRAMRNVSLNLGKDYEAITVSFDPKDGPAEAEVKRRIYSGLYGRAGSSRAWHFLTGDQKSIDSLTNAVGFHAVYDKDSGQFAHAATILILTPEGRVARYFYGLQYPSRDFRLALVEASEGKIGSPTDAALLFCYHYDPLTGKYGLMIVKLMRVAGGLTVLVLGIFLFVMFRRERNRPRVAPALRPGVR